MKNRVAWLLCMAALSLVLAGIVLSRLEAKTDIIFGGMDGAIVSTDTYVYEDPNKAEETEEEVDDGWPDIDITQGQYRMVNDDTEFLLPSSFEPTCGVIDGTKYMMFDADYLPYLNAMIHAAEEAGHTVYIAAAYRTYSYQTQMFNAKASQLAGDIDYMDPRYQQYAEKAKTIVMYPGSSEHQLGLAVDIMDRQRKSLIYENMDQELFAWLDAHCAEYGFIKRYPTRKLLLTGWDEPWHYRYVGVEAATYIMEHGICYEEFYKHYMPDFKY
ncbi:MAG: M15 family metallopeptidase [Oscillospiraceae bacterium]|nr:M15 family metallopeptidase [Oscillospiraceae bacterium]